MSQHPPGIRTIQEKMRVEPVSRLNLREALAVNPSLKVKHAIATMRAKGLGCVIVVEEESGRPLGVFSELGMIQLLLDDPLALDQSVGQHMDEHWGCVHQEEPIVQLIETMFSNRTRYVVVIDEDGRAVALTGERSVCEYVTAMFPRGVLTTRIDEKPEFKEREGA